jgi:CheY-like chemotaxis protein
VLQKLGYEVDGTTSSPEALEIFKASPDQFALVFVDETMPVMTGSQLAEEMLLLRPDIPIILMTGFDIEDVIDKTKNLGIHQYLSKPIKYPQLSEIVRRLLGM